MGAGILPARRLRGRRADLGSVDAPDDLDRPEPEPHTNQVPPRVRFDVHAHDADYGARVYSSSGMSDAARNGDLRLAAMRDFETAEVWLCGGELEMLQAPAGITVGLRPCREGG